MSQVSYEEAKKKVYAAYFTAKYECSINQYPRLLQLEQKTGLKMDYSYSNDKAGAEFISVINEAMGIRLIFSTYLKDINFHEH